MKIRNKKEYKIRRSHLRKNMPAPELVIWQVIRNNALGIKFRRQFSIENYVLDFYAPSANLAIEINGDSHYENQAAILRDKIRDQVLAIRYGVKVLRFTNREIIDNLEGVTDKIIEDLPPLNLPLFKEQEEKITHK